MRKAVAFMKVHLSIVEYCYCDLHPSIETSIETRDPLATYAIYFLAAAASSALSFARFSRLPANLASLLASLNFR
jgi:hypothetical protein